MAPPLVGQFARMAHQTQENPLTHWIISLLQRLLKDTNQQPDGELYKVRSQTRIFCPHGTWGPAACGKKNSGSPTWKLSKNSKKKKKKKTNELSFRVFMEASLHSHD